VALAVAGGEYVTEACWVTDLDCDIITFDCYGTLIDWETGIINAFQSEASHRDVSLDPDSIIAAYMSREPAVEAERYCSYREVLGETARRVGAALDLTIADDRTGFLAESLASWRPFQEANPALERLAQRFELGIVSNIDDDLLEETLRHFTVGFSLIVTAQQVKSYKPSLDHFNEALARTEGMRLLHAAQSHFHDVVPAKRLNVPVVWVNRKAEEIGEGGVRPTFEVRNLAELADLLEV
jgi:2-haloacid dehalogenase/putative hydrolase of the HAD superfamily